MSFTAVVEIRSASIDFVDFHAFLVPRHCNEGWNQQKLMEFWLQRKLIDQSHLTPSLRMGPTLQPSQSIHLNVHIEFDPGMVGKCVLYMTWRHLCQRSSLSNKHKKPAPKVMSRVVRTARQSIMWSRTSFDSFFLLILNAMTKLMLSSKNWRPGRGNFDYRWDCQMYGCKWLGATTRFVSVASNFLRHCFCPSIEKESEERMCPTPLSQGHISLTSATIVWVELTKLTASSLNPFTATGLFHRQPPRWPTFLAMLFQILKEGIGFSLSDELEVQYHVIKK